ncbi:MAG: YncE family protein [Candidatus Caenarcaniphilales bacterium]|nr:YncE family protein [Candidatus Caenarcaniphilales bacterium]
MFHLKNALIKHFNKKKITCFVAAISLLGFINPQTALSKSQDLYYLSSSGYLIKLDVEKIAETGQVAAGSLPWSAASCSGHIYFTDFGSDQLFDFSPKDKILNKVKLEDIDNTLAVQEIELLTPPEEEIDRSPIQKAFAKVYKSKPKQKSFDPVVEPLDIAAHNKKLGLSCVACNKNYVFVITTLKNRVEILSREDLSRVASFKVGERPSHVAISPNGKTIAISSTGVNKVYLANTDSFTKEAEIDVQEGPTEIVWLNDQKLFVLNRGSNSISVIDNSNKSLSNNIDLPNSSINNITAFENEDRIYALDGSDKKLYVIDAKSYSFETKEVNSSLKFPNLLQKIEDNKLLIGSEPDGKFLILDTKSFETIKKIQTNLPPKTIVRLMEDYQTVQLENSYPVATINKSQEDKKTDLDSEKKNSKDLENN